MDAGCVILRSSEGIEERLHLPSCAHEDAHTGAELWPASRSLAQWLCSQPAELLSGSRVIELACGLALPSFVAARRGAMAKAVLATDESEPLLDHVRRNAQLNGISSIMDTRRLDFTNRRQVEAVADATAWDVVLFSEGVYSKQLGEALPHALATLLLRAGPHARAIGSFSAHGRAGVARFWEEAAMAKLHWEEAVTSCSCGESSARLLRVEGGGRSAASAALYVFRATAQTRPRSDWGSEGDSGGDCELMRGVWEESL